MVVGERIAGADAQRRGKCVGVTRQLRGGGRGRGYGEPTRRGGPAQQWKFPKGQPIQDEHGGARAGRCRIPPFSEAVGGSGHSGAKFAP